MTTSFAQSANILRSRKLSPVRKKFTRFCCSELRRTRGALNFLDNRLRWRVGAEVALVSGRDRYIGNLLCLHLDDICSIATKATPLLCEPDCRISMLGISGGPNQAIYIRRARRASCARASCSGPRCIRRVRSGAATTAKSSSIVTMSWSITRVSRRVTGAFLFYIRMTYRLQLAGPRRLIAIQELAEFAVEKVIGAYRRPGRRFWYCVEDDNAESIRVAEKTGFSLVGIGEWVVPLGVELLSYYRILDPARVQADTAMTEPIAAASGAAARV